MKRIAVAIALLLLCVALPSGCCDETAEDQGTTPPAPAERKSTQEPVSPVPVKPSPEAAKVETKKEDKAAQQAPEAAAQPPAQEAAPVEPAPSDDPLLGKSPEEVDAILAERDAQAKTLAKAIGVDTGKGQWEIGHAGKSSAAQIVVAVKEDTGGGVPNFKAGLVRDGKVLGTTSDFAAFTGASPKQMEVRRQCAHWGSETHQDLIIDGNNKAFRVSFWCQRKDGTGAELVTVMAVPAKAQSLDDVKRLWTGEGGSLGAPEGECQSTTVAKFRIEGAELVRDYTVTTSPSKPPVNGEPTPVVDCPVPQAPEAARFAIAP